MGQATSDTSSRSENVSQPTNQKPWGGSQNQTGNPNQGVNLNQPRYNYTGNAPYNPNYMNQPQPQYNQSQYTQPQTNTIVKKPKATLTMNNLKDVFRFFAIDGKYLSHQRFDDTIEKLFSRIDIPSMHYTYLSERIYFLLDVSRDCKISEDEFMNGMQKVLTDKEFRLKCNIFFIFSNDDGYDGSS